MNKNDKKLKIEVYKELISNPNSAFNILTVGQKKFLQEQLVCSFYQEGESIYREGEKPKGLVYLYEGKVKIVKQGVGDRDQIVRMVKSNGFIGYRALLAGENNIASAIAIEDCATCNINGKLVIKLIKENPKFALRIIRSLAIELGFSNNRTLTLTQKHVRGRMAESLLFLKGTYGTEQDGITINIYLSREDIANLSNMTVSTAIRTLSAFASEKIIAVDGRRIKILNDMQLDQISKLG